MNIREIVKRIVWPYRRHRSRTVRFAFPFMFVVATFLGANVIDSETKSFIEIESSTQSVRAGEMFQISVFASAHTPINAIDIALSFPDAQIEVTGVDTGESVITLWTEQPYVENNQVIMRGGTFRKGFLGRHLIATINARAEETGVAYFEVANSSFLAGDGTGDAVEVSESGEEQATLYIADTDGALVVNDEENGIGADITLRIVSDIDGDGEVSLRDVSRFMAAWSTKTETFDFSGDGKMTFKDFAIILAHTFLR